MFVDAEFVQNHCIGRIEEMKIFRLRNLLLASSALALMMLFGCSSSEESSDSASGSSGDDNMSCDANDTRQECADDIM
jgi:hypothetical protein